MRLRNVKGAEEIIANSLYVIQDPGEYKGKWNTFFGNDHPIHIEIGMGKGKFVHTLAELHPEINYIGIEMYSAAPLRRDRKKIFPICILSEWMQKKSLKYLMKMR